MNSTSTILSELVTAWARKVPEKIAFKNTEDQITYGELDRRSNQVANWLVQNQVKKGDRVGILIDKNIFAAYAVYGILKAGAILVALDPSQPSTKLDTIIVASGIKVVITVAQHQRIVDALNTSTLQILGNSSGVNWEDVFANSSSIALKISIDKSDLAYILYTSGSTGEPKGIVHTHESGMAYARQSVALYEVSEADVIGNVASLHFDQSTFGYFSSMYAGSTTYVFNTSELIMLGSFCEATRANDISILYSVPSLFISLVQGNFDLNFPSVRWIKYGGESFPPSMLNELMERAPAAKLSNVYGPAEVNQCTYYTLPGRVEVGKEVPIGQVWSNTSYLILDSTNQPVSQGEQGEFLVTSTTMMSGYWNNADLNAKSFFETVQNGVAVKYYRTGDFVYLNENEELVFVGRMDRQFKISGHRIELGAIEQLIENCDEVQAVAVFTSKSAEMRELCAAIVPASSNFDKEVFRKKLMKILPKNSVPKHIFKVKSLPHSVNGKIHYKKLESDYSIEQ